MVRAVEVLISKLNFIFIGDGNHDNSVLPSPEVPSQPRKNPNRVREMFDDLKSNDAIV